MRRYLIIVLSLVALLLSISLAIGASNNYYSKTSMYFNVPGDATFSIAMPSDYGSWTDITGTTEGGATVTNWISFNFTEVPQSNLQQPYQLGNSANNQNGATRPIMYIDNTGNCNEKFDIKLVGSLPSNVFVYFNATGGTTPTTTLTLLTTSYQQVVASLSTTQFLNLTLWANTSAGINVGQTTQDFYLRSTCV